MAETGQLRYDDAKANLAVSVVFGFLALAAVLVRYHARFTTHARPAWDDHVIFIAMVMMAPNIAAKVQDQIDLP